jgi:1-deoxy-D-xylulose-5-phosphate synthase
MKLALEFALNANKPVAIRYPKDKMPAFRLPIADLRLPFELGKSAVVRKVKKASVLIVSYGAVLTEALKAADILAQEGIEVDIINARFASPVDEGIISAFSKYKRIITVEDHYIDCGFGSAVLEVAVSLGDRIKKSLVMLGVPNRFIKHNSRSAQLIEAGISADKIVEAIKKLGM